MLCFNKNFTLKKEMITQGKLFDIHDREDLNYTKVLTNGEKT